MHNLCPHHCIHRILVPKPVLPATIDHAAVRTFDHIPTRNANRHYYPARFPGKQKHQTPLAVLFTLTQTRHILQDPSRGSRWKQMSWALR